jgi:hypothetical protein
MQLCILRNKAHVLSFVITISVQLERGPVVTRQSFITIEQISKRPTLVHGILNTLPSEEPEEWRLSAGDFCGCL